MAYITVQATDSTPTILRDSDIIRPGYEVYSITHVRRFDLTEYAKFHLTGWYAIKVNPNDPKKDEYIPIIKINDLCVYEGRKTLFTRKDLLPENIQKKIMPAL